MLENLQGIGPKTINMLNNMGIYSIKDLLFYFPYRYDILKRSDISNLSSRDKVVTSGVIDGQPTMIFITESFKKIIFRIDTGSGILNITIYNKNNLYKELSSGKVVTVIGIYDRSKNTVIASSIRFEELPISPKIDPVYITHNIISKKGFVKILKSGIDWAYNNDISVDNEVSRATQGSLPDFIIDKYNFLSTLKAISEVHFPSDITMLKRARKRLKYEELFNYLLKNKYATKKIREGKKFIKRRDISKDIYAFIEKNNLNFSASQKMCIKDIFDDLAKNSRMYRMVMGNKYSGKFDCVMMGCFYNYLSGHKSIILTNSDKDSEYVYERVNALSELMGLNIGIIKKGDNDNEVIGIDNRESNVDGKREDDCIGDLFGELKEEDISKKEDLGNDDNICVKKDNYKDSNDKEISEELFGDYDVVICNGNIDFGDTSKSNFGLCVIYNGDGALNNFALIKIFADSKADILCVSDFAISEKRDVLLYEGMDISRVLMCSGLHSVSVKTKVYKRKDREMIFANMDACLERGCSVIVVTSKSSANDDESWIGDSEEIGDDVKPFIDNINEHFCDKGNLIICDVESNVEVLGVFESFIRKDASVLCIDSEKFDLVDGTDIVKDVLCNKKVGMVIIDGGEEFSLSRLDNYRCMMQGYVCDNGNIYARKMEMDNDTHSAKNIDDGKRCVNFDIIVNDNERDMRILEEQVSGFVISDYDFMYKGSERFDWFKRGDGGMFICNIKKDFNMMGRVKDDADKYFELFIDNAGWFEKVVKG